MIDGKGGRERLKWGKRGEGAWGRMSSFPPISFGIGLVSLALFLHSHPLLVPRHWRFFYVFDSPPGSVFVPAGAG